MKPRKNGQNHYKIHMQKSDPSASGNSWYFFQLWFVWQVRIHKPVEMHVLQNVILILAFPIDAAVPSEEALGVDLGG